MDDLKRGYLRLCKESNIEPQESVLNQMHNVRDGSPMPRLDLATQSLSVDTCAVLGKVLLNDGVFTEIMLCDCMLNEEGAKLLLRGLCSNSTVKTLDIKGNNLRAAGAEALGKLLRHNKSLKSLILEWNALGMWEEGFSIFCEGVRANKVLQRLDLRNNQINHQGAGELALALKNNDTLEELDLRWNNIGLLGGRALLSALQQNKSLVRLELAGNNIPSDILKAVDQAVDHNSDRQATLKENRCRTKILSNEVHFLKTEKNKQSLPFSFRTSAMRVGQLQEALNERTSIVNSLRAKVQMTEAALTLSEQKSNDLKEFLNKMKAEKFELKERHTKDLKKEQEVDELERKCKVQQDQIFELKQEMTIVTAELKMRIAQTEDLIRCYIKCKDYYYYYCKCICGHLHLFLCQELSRVKSVSITERAKAEEELMKVRSQVRLEEQQRLSHLEEKLRLLTQSRDESQNHCTQQKQTISELQAKNNKLTFEVEGLKHRIDELFQEMSGKDQEKVTEVNKVRVELQEQIGHLQAERATQEGFKEKISTLERQLKAQSNSHRDALLDKESELASLLEKIRLKDSEIVRMREDEAQRASFLQNAILSYVQGSPLGLLTPKK
uniref:Leucine rich repeat containing 45 n=1 Tax=Callorhinchus milii TaxID=7868 RepID=A0A4W3JZ14_CALMI